MSSAVPWWATLLIDWHTPAAYICAIVFPVWRWIRLKYAQRKIDRSTFIHQAATGFVLPSFVMLCGSYGYNDLADHIAPHEMGIAGLFAVIISLGELITNGHGDDGNDSSGMFS